MVELEIKCNVFVIIKQSAKINQWKLQICCYLQTQNITAYIKSPASLKDLKYKFRNGDVIAAGQQFLLKSTQEFNKMQSIESQLFWVLCWKQKKLAQIATCW